MYKRIDSLYKRDKPPRKMSDIAFVEQSDKGYHYQGQLISQERYERLKDEKSFIILSILPPGEEELIGW